VIWVPSNEDKQALVQDAASPFFATAHFNGHLGPPSVENPAARRGAIRLVLGGFSDVNGGGRGAVDRRDSREGGWVGEWIAVDREQVGVESGGDPSLAVPDVAGARRGRGDGPQALDQVHSDHRGAGHTPGRCVMRLVGDAPVGGRASRTPAAA